eukprot:NODE_1497_length_1710_cov_83.586641_g1419_i0.p1 GENE.NODE_1497_length_1710_cov_83.586641_g1419_i0~~NODE_1497_length_1710_cov_83.586641_g1419_i0.p1  ORF type:complete len:485 (+),score=134.19 NODE_1497_length_1710_cov_83.586641_g1419_i0:147-1601(+)
MATATTASTPIFDRQSRRVRELREKIVQSTVKKYKQKYRVQDVSEESLLSLHAGVRDLMKKGSVLDSDLKQLAGRLRPSTAKATSSLPAADDRPRSVSPTKADRVVHDRPQTAVPWNAHRESNTPPDQMVRSTGPGLPGVPSNTARINYGLISVVREKQETRSRKQKEQARVKAELDMQVRLRRKREMAALADNEDQHFSGLSFFELQEHHQKAEQEKRQNEVSKLYKDITLQRKERELQRQQAQEAARREAAEALSSSNRDAQLAQQIVQQTLENKQARILDCFRFNEALKEQRRQTKQEQMERDLAEERYLMQVRQSEVDSRVAAREAEARRRIEEVSRRGDKAAQAAVAPVEHLTSDETVARIKAERERKAQEQEEIQRRKKQEQRVQARAINMRQLQAKEKARRLEREEDIRERQRLERNIECAETIEQLQESAHVEMKERWREELARQRDQHRKRAGRHYALLKVGDRLEDNLDERDPL